MTISHLSIVCAYIVFVNEQETIHIPENDLTALTQESLENPKGIERLERAAVSLYKALLSTRDSCTFPISFHLALSTLTKWL